MGQAHFTSHMGLRNKKENFLGRAEASLFPGQSSSAVWLAGSNRPRMHNADRSIGSFQADRDTIVLPPGGVRVMITFGMLSIAMTVGVKLSMD